MTIDLLAGAAAQRLHLSGASAFLLAAAAAAVFVVMSQLLCTSRRSARICYWVGSTVTAALLTTSVALYERPLRVVVLTLALCIFFTVGFAYFAGWQLKINGRTRSVFVKNTYPDPPEDGSDPPPSPPPPANSYNGVVTADGFWWIAAVLTAVIAADVYLFGWVWQSVLGTIALTLMGALAGLDDASRSLPMVRGQRIPALIALLASLLLWMLPAISYVTGYMYGKRRPLRGSARSAQQLRN